MKDKILEEAMLWYESQKGNPNISEFVDIVISKTADNIFEKIKDELKNEFENGNLKHPFIISSDYYLELKFKEIKNKLIRNKIPINEIEDTEQY